MSLTSVGGLLTLSFVANTSVTIDQIFAAPYARRQAFPVGETWMSVFVEVAGVDRRDSNVSYEVGLYSFIFLYHLPDYSDSSTYRTTTMLTDQSFLMDPNSWRVAGVYELRAVPELTPVERFGNVMEYTVSAQLSISP